MLPIVIRIQLINIPMYPTLLTHLNQTVFIHLVVLVSQVNWLICQFKVSLKVNATRDRSPSGFQVWHLQFKFLDSVMFKFKLV